MSKRKRNKPKVSIWDRVSRFDLLIAFLMFCLSPFGIYKFFLLIENPPRYLAWLEFFSGEDLGGITSLLTFALVFGGLIFAFIDRKQNEAAEKREKQKLSYEQYKNIHEHLTSPEQEEARRWIYVNIPIKTEEQPMEEWLTKVDEAISEKPRGWKEERTPGQAYLKMVLNDFDYIGFIYKNFWDIQPDLEEAYIGWLSPPVAKVWERIGPYVEAQRTARNEPDYYKAAGAIGEYAIRWRKEKGYSKSEIIKDTI